MLRVHRFEQDCQYIEDTKHHKLYHIPAEQCGIFQVLHGALFAGTALCGAALGLSLPLWLAVSAGCMLACLLYTSSPAMHQIADNNVISIGYVPAQNRDWHCNGNRDIKAVSGCQCKISS